MKFPSPKAPLLLAGCVLVLAAAGCSRKSASNTPQSPAAPPAAGSTSQPSTPAPSTGGSGSQSEPVAAKDLAPVFFGYDSANLDEAARAALDRNARLLRESGNWRITVEGHCDERGTVEYNLALGERRARVVRDWLLDAGIAAGRVEMVSYGKERPFDEGHDESAWVNNRRAQFVLR